MTVELAKSLADYDIIVIIRVTANGPSYCRPLQRSIRADAT